MHMIDSLKFVQGAVSKKDFVPAMTHFAIEHGTVRAYNGSLALCSPIAFNINCNPKAEPLVQAISNCERHVTLAMKPNGKLSIKSGKFNAFIDCIKEEVPHAMPEGPRIKDFDGAAMLAALKVLHPFIGEDASRPFCNGVLLRGNSAFATNNVIVIQYWLGASFPIQVNLPRSAVYEMLRINEAPTHAQATETAMTFHYSDGRWIRTQLLQTDWPDVEQVLALPCAPIALPETLFEALEAIKPFSDKLGRVFMKEGVFSTCVEEGEGAKYDVPEMTSEGVYRLEMLELLKGVAQSIDFTTYPKPCIFHGDRLRGAIVGMRM